MNFLVRTEGDPTLLVGPIRDELLAMDPEIPLDAPLAMAELVDRQLAANRFALSLIGMFAAIAASLALVGLYGILSYAVGQRTREIGIRVALGSPRLAVHRLVLGRGLGLTLIGLVLGVTAAAVSSRFLGSFLFGTSTHDPATYAGVSLAFLLCAGIASYVPARRAAGLDPAAVLRSE